MTAPPLPEPLDPESTGPVDPWADWADTDEDDDGWEPHDWAGQDRVLPRPAAVPCARPRLCQWRACADSERYLVCDAHGCGAGCDTAAELVEDDDGTAEASRWHPVRTISVGEFL